MHPEQPRQEPDREEEYVGQIVQDATPWKEERITPEQMEGWDEARRLLTDAFAEADPRIRIDFFELRGQKRRTLSDPFAAKAAPEIAIRLGSTELALLQGTWLNRQVIDLDGLRARLDGLVQDVLRTVEERKRKLEGEA